jgi:hypothetical protein
MTNEEINKLAYDKDIACYGVMGCARAFLNMHKSGLPLQYLPWETLEKYLDKFEALEKELKSALSDEEAA